MTKILIIDDDESVCRSLKCLLGTYGFEATTFPSGDAFFSAGKSLDNACLILDIHLPGMDGWEIQRRLTMHRNIIMLTAHRMEGQQERALQAGVAGLLYKPFKVRELVSMIEEVFSANALLRKKDAVRGSGKLSSSKKVKKS